MNDLTEKVLNIPNREQLYSLFGPQDRNLKIWEEEEEVVIFFRNNNLFLQGKEEKVNQFKEMFEVLLELSEKGHAISEHDIYYALELSKIGKVKELLDLHQETIITSFKGKAITARTLGQRHYLTAIRKKDIVFGIGPAGTGKTYLAVVLAVSSLKQGTVRKIVLTRPAVEAGESLGFLPGDLQEKVDPYLRPLYDALYDVLGVEQVNRYLERGIIEIAPLAYMRGRTLEDAFIILDEAQNTTKEQMKMFLTRLGFGSKMVITGDITQIDLPKGKDSGLIEAERILKEIPDIAFIHLKEQDVVRHHVVQKVIRAYANV